MDSRRPSRFEDDAQDDDRFFSFCRDVFEWPKLPETLEAEIRLRLAEVESVSDWEWDLMRRSPKAPATNGMEPNMMANHG